MKPFTSHTGIAAPLDRANVDTDQIIPKQFLKRIARTGYDDALFYDWRYLADGKTPDPEFELNKPRYEGVSVLVARDNFGSGSSREHAPWALDNYGFRVIIAPSFADIFYNNCFNNGLLPIVLPAGTVDALFNEIWATEGYKLMIDLEAQKVVKPDGTEIPFEIDAFKKHRMLNGLDQIGVTLQNEDKIAAYETSHAIA